MTDGLQNRCSTTELNWHQKANRNAKRPATLTAPPPQFNRQILPQNKVPRDNQRHSLVTFPSAASSSPSVRNMKITMEKAGAPDNSQTSRRLFLRTAARHINSKN